MCGNIIISLVDSSHIMKKIVSGILLSSFCAAHAIAQHVAISFTKMNVVYIGVANPVTIVAENTDSKDLIVTTDNGEIRRSGNYDGYDYYPHDKGKATISVSVHTSDGTKKLQETVFRVKKIPAPTVRLCLMTGGYISRAMLCVQIGPSANIEGFGFDAHYTIYKCKVSVVKDSAIVFEKYLSAPNGVRFDEETNKMFCSLTPGSTVWITDVACKGPGGDYTDLNELKFIVDQ